MGFAKVLFEGGIDSASDKQDSSGSAMPMLQAYMNIKPRVATPLLAAFAGNICVGKTGCCNSEASASVSNKQIQFCIVVQIL